MRCFTFATVLLLACSDSASPADEPVVDAGSEAAPAPAPTSVVDASTPPPAVALDVPESLVKALGGKTYVEGSCESVMQPGWPYEAQRCTYQNGLVVTIANPTPERVARWIVEASSLIPALDGLHDRDRTNWEAGLKVIAAHTIGQSSRIFPLAGKVFENGTAYSFDRGVTSTCGTGCYCRINSLSRAQWCKYATTVLASEPNEADCLSKYGQTDNKLTEPWLVHCLDNHVTAWNADQNAHYRAQAWNANLALATAFPDPKTADGAAVVTALKKQYPAS